MRVRILNAGNPASWVADFVRHNYPISDMEPEKFNL